MLEADLRSQNAAELLATSKELYERQPLRLRSRVHPSRYLSTATRTVWLKRDDELSFGASGTKVRKFASLVEHFRSSGVGGVVVTGALNSHGVLAAGQFLQEAGLAVELVLREPRDLGLVPVVFELTRQLVGEDAIVRIPRDDWDLEAPRACADARRALESAGHRVQVVLEGGGHVAALPGAMTLALDLESSEREAAVVFSDVFVEAGTGVSAFALATALALRRYPWTLHILSTARPPDDLAAAFDRWSTALGAPQPENVNWYDAAQTVPVEAWLLSQPTMQAAMRADGILFDPVYTGRLILLAARLVEDGELGPGDVAVVHSGGALGLLAYSLSLRPGGDRLEALEETSRL